MRKFKRLFYGLIVLFMACETKVKQEKKTVNQTVNQAIILPDSSTVNFDKIGDCIQLDWKILEKTKFVEKRIDSLNSYASIPTFPLSMRRIEGQQVAMKGYVIPVEETGDEQVLVLSANSYSACFFCGQAGPASVMDIRLKNPKKLRRFKQDEQVTFEGKLRLNETNFYFFNYILEDAELIK